MFDPKIHWVLLLGTQRCLPGSLRAVSPGPRPHSLQVLPWSKSHFFSSSLCRLDPWLDPWLAGLFVIRMNREPSVFIAFAWSPVLAWGPGSPVSLFTVIPMYHQIRSMHLKFLIKNKALLYFYLKLGRIRMFVCNGWCGIEWRLLQERGPQQGPMPHSPPRESPHVGCVNGALWVCIVLRGRDWRH